MLAYCGRAQAVTAIDGYEGVSAACTLLQGMVSLYRSGARPPRSCLFWPGRVPISEMSQDPQRSWPIVRSGHERGIITWSSGQGDGDIPRLLATLNALDFTGYLTLEPHLSFAGPAGGYSGEAGMRTAIHALKALLASMPPLGLG